MTARCSETSSVFSYELYGLGVRCAFPLPEARPAELECAVEIRVGPVPGLSWRNADRDGSFRISTGDAKLAWSEVGSFWVRGGREIIVDPAPAVDDRVVRLLLLGPVLAVLLHQRGLLVLHAGVVEMGGGAVLFLGGPRWGKSTIAAALYHRGHCLVADDVAAVRTDTAVPLALPGIPQLKLWPDTVAALGEPLDTLARLHPKFEKRSRPTVRGFATNPVRLARIYVLAEGEGHAIEPLSPQEALIELVRHTYAARLLRAMGAAAHFRRCGSLIGRIPIRRLRTCRSLDLLPALVRMVEEDAVDAA